MNGNKPHKDYDWFVDQVVGRWSEGSRGVNEDAVGDAASPEPNVDGECPGEQGAESARRMEEE